MGFYSRRRRRATTPLVLALWLFALLASIAHACGLDGDFRHAVFNMPAAASAHQAPADSTSPACEKFCADDSALLTKLKAVEDSPAGSAFLVPAPIAGPVAIAARLSEPLSGPDPPPGIAINTRFVRLAL